MRPSKSDPTCSLRRRLKDAGYTAARLKQQGYTAAELAFGARGRVDLKSFDVSGDDRAYTAKEVSDS